ncbi:hypothetical protein PR001_g30424 [Phytophthora rubi]|uniref:Uncharacterized protein n=2 Tax=Phytophthora rubi TaxID=129364 RepID=A0A6A3GTP3_9STRA|nr:hypothetical protein PR001_g30424 [Phytophthora rubi]
MQQEASRGSKRKKPEQQRTSGSWAFAIPMHRARARVARMVLEGLDMQQPTRTTTLTKAVACVAVGAVVVSGNAGAAAAAVAAVAAFRIDETSLGQNAWRGADWPRESRS